MKNLLLAGFLIFSGCSGQTKIKAESDNETFKKLLAWDDVFFFEMYGDFSVSGEKGNVHYRGKGRSLSSAYEDSLKHMTITCEVNP